MAQLKQVCAVTQNSQTVTITGVDLTARIRQNYIFMVEGILVPYVVATDSTFVGGDTVVTLTGNYVQSTNPAANGVFVTDYTYPDLIPVIAQGDVGTAAVFTQAMYKLQEKLIAGPRTKEGANAKQGIATLVAGAVTVANTSVTANSRIFLTTQSLGTVTSPKAIGVTARVAGTSFTISSADVTDTSVIAYEIFEPA